MSNLVWVVMATTVIYVFIFFKLGNPASKIWWTSSRCVCSQSDTWNTNNEDTTPIGTKASGTDEGQINIENTELLLFSCSQF